MGVLVLSLAFALEAHAQQQLEKQSAGQHQLTEAEQELQAAGPTGFALARYGARLAADKATTPEEHRHNYGVVLNAFAKAADKLVAQKVPARHQATNFMRWIDDLEDVVQATVAKSKSLDRKLPVEWFHSTQSDLADAKDKIWDEAKRATSFVQVGHPDQRLPNLKMINAAIKDTYQQIQNNGRNQDMESVQAFADIERGLQRSIGEVDRELETDKGMMDSTEALQHVMEQTAGAVAESNVKDQATIQSSIDGINKAYYNNDCKKNTGLLFAGEECPDEFPGKQVVNADTLTKEAEDETDELKEEFEDEKDEIEDEKKDMQKDVSNEVDQLTSYSDDQKKGVDDSLEDKKASSDEKISMGKNTLTQAGAEVKSAIGLVDKAEPLIEKAESAQNKEAERTQAEIDKIKERTVAAITKYAEGGMSSMSSADQQAMNSLIKEYGISDKKLEAGGKELEKAIEDAWDTMESNIEKQNTALQSGPVELAKQLEKIQSGAIMDGIQGVSQVESELNQAEQQAQAANQQAANTLQQAAQQPLASDNMQEPTEAAETTALQPEVNKGIQAMHDVFKLFTGDATSATDFTQEKIQGLMEHLVQSGLSVDQLLQSMGGKLSAEDLKAACSQMVATGHAGQKAMAQEMLKLFGSGGSMQSALATAQDDDSGFGFENREAQEQISTISDQDTSEMNQVPGQTKSELDAMASQGRQAIADMGNTIVADVTEMNTQLRGTQDSANAATAAADSFVGNDLDPFKTNGEAAAMGLRRQAQEQLQQDRAAVQRYLSSARGNLQLSMTQLQKTQEQYEQMQKDLLTKDDYETKTLFNTLKSDLEDTAKSEINSHLASANAKLQEAAELVPEDSDIYKAAVARINKIQGELAAIKPMDTKTHAQEAEEQFNKMLASAMREALDDMEEGEEDYMAEGQKKANAAMGAIQDESSHVMTEAEKMKKGVVDQLRTLLKEQDGLGDKLKDLTKDDDSQEAYLAGLAMALSGDAAEASGASKMQFDEIVSKMKEDAREENAGIKGAMDAALGSEAGQLDQFMTGVFARLDGSTEAAARGYYTLATDVADKEKQVKERDQRASDITAGAVTSLEQYLELQGTFDADVEAKLKELYGDDLAAGVNKAKMQGQQAEQAANAAFGLLNGIETMFEHGAMADVGARSAADQAAMQAKLAAVAQAEKQAAAEAEAAAAKEKALLEEAAEAFQGEVAEVHNKWHEMERQWQGLSQANQYEAQSLTSQGRALHPNFVDEMARVKVNRDKLMQKALGIMASLYMAVFRGVERIERESHGHVETSMGYINSMADAESRDGIKILDKLRDADVLTQIGHGEIKDLTAFATNYAELDAQWRKEVVKAFQEFAVTLGKNSDDINARILALDRSIAFDVDEEEQNDMAEIVKAENQTRAETDAEGNRVNAELGDLRMQESNRNTESGVRIDGAEGAINGEFGSAELSAEQLEAKMAELNSKVENLEPTLNEVKGKEKAVQDEQLLSVAKDRADLQGRLHAAMTGEEAVSSDTGSDAGSDTGSDAGSDSDSGAGSDSDSGAGTGLSQLSGEDKLFADEPSSFLQNAQRRGKLGKLDGKKVMTMIAAGVPEEEVGKLLMERHRALVAKLHKLKH